MASLRNALGLIASLAVVAVGIFLFLWLCWWFLTLLVGRIFILALAPIVVTLAILAAASDGLVLEEFTNRYQQACLELGESPRCWFDLAVFREDGPDIAQLFAERIEVAWDVLQCAPEQRTRTRWAWSREPMPDGSRYILWADGRIELVPAEDFDICREP